MELKNSIVLVVGAAGMIGSEFTKSLLDHGAICILVDNDKNKINQLKKKLRKYDATRYIFRKVNIINEKQVISLKNYLKKEFQRLDGLVNLVANDPKVIGKKNKFKKFEDTDLNNFQKDLQIGLTGMMLVNKHLIHILKKSKKASVINMASDLSVISPDHRIYSKKKIDYFSKPISYSIVKHGVIGLTKYLATYYGSQNIRFNSISPGGISQNQNKEFQKKISNLIPLKRMAKLEEINSALIYLLSEKSSYTTGINLVVDGGRSVW